MNEHTAAALAQFVKDHDKRFTAAVRPVATGDGLVVILTRADDGTELPALRTFDEHRRTQIENNDPGPTVRAAWENWLGEPHR
jgi:hypothetical protein